MAYVDFEFYKTIYGENAIPEIDFNRLSWDACKKLDNATTGVDNVKKLKVAFPRDEDDALTVKRCVCELVSILYRLEQAENTLQSAKGYVQREDGSLQGKVVSSVSAGNESISYSANGGSNTVTMFDKALADKAVQEQLFRDTITGYLSGVADANGVNLLYMGRYPYRVR